MIYAFRRMDTRNEIYVSIPIIVLSFLLITMRDRQRQELHCMKINMSKRYLMILKHAINNEHALITDGDFNLSLDRCDYRKTIYELCNQCLTNIAKLDFQVFK